MNPERSRVRLVALWIAIPVLLLATAFLAPPAIDAWRYVEEWELGEHEATVHRFKIDRWEGVTLEADTWSTTTGLRLRQSSWSAKKRVRDTIWDESGVVSAQHAQQPDGSLTIWRGPPWQWGVEDRSRDEPWFEVGFQAWKKSVVFREPLLPR